MARSRQVGQRRLLASVADFAPLLGTKGTMARVLQAAAESFEERFAALATMAGDRWRLNQKP